MGSSQQFSLRWNNYLSHITGAFDNLRSEEDLVDVTLSCEGKRIRAHKMLLSACSTYFRDLFKENPCQHPVIIFRNVKFEDLVALVDFMYQGEVNVVQEQLASFLTTAELLAVQGLSEGTTAENSKEPDLPDSPMLPPEPEVQVGSNNHSQKQKHGSTSSSGVGSPISFFPLEQRSESPPTVKRRKWGSSSGAGGKGSAVNVSCKKESDRESDSERRRGSSLSATNQPVRNSSPDPVEIIPVVPSLKMEIPDYMDQDQDGSSCSYSDSNQGTSGGGGGGGQSNRETLSSVSQVLPHTSASGSGEGKQEPPDLYSANSRDASLPPATESLSASDLSQILVKPGPSGENQVQDSLQACWRFKKNVDLEHMVRHDKLNRGMKCFPCNICGKQMHHWKSLDLHMKMHSGETKCHVCNKVLNRSYALKLHLFKVHGILPFCSKRDASVVSTFLSSRPF